MNVQISSQYSEHYYFNTQNDETCKSDLLTLQSYSQSLLNRVDILEKRQKNLQKKCDNSLSYSSMGKKWALLGGGFIGLAAYLNNPAFIGFAVLSGFPSLMLSLPITASRKLYATIDSLKTVKKLLKEVENCTLKKDITSFLKKVDDSGFVLSIKNCKKANNFLQCIGKSDKTAQVRLELLPLTSNDKKLADIEVTYKRELFSITIQPLRVWINNMDYLNVSTLKERVKTYLNIKQENR